MAEDPQELSRLYQRRFQKSSACRRRVWEVLARDFFQRWIPTDAALLDLGCGYGEFINNIRAGKKWAMDLNPDAARHLAGDVTFLEQDCSTPWRMADCSLEVVFTSNFFEHLPDKPSLRRTLRQAHRCLKSGGRLLAVGPNAKYLAGQYWDFFDHHTVLTEASLGEVLETEGFVLEQVVPRFLPYTLINSPEYPILLLKWYLAMPWLWWIKGRQFLIRARKNNGPPAKVQ